MKEGTLTTMRTLAVSFKFTNGLGFSLLRVNGQKRVKSGGKKKKNGR